MKNFHCYCCGIRGHKQFECRTKIDKKQAKQEAWRSTHTRKVYRIVKRHDEPWWLPISKVSTSQKMKGLKKNHLSVVHLCEDENFDITFNSSKCEVLDKDHKVCTTGRKSSENNNVMETLDVENCEDNRVGTLSHAVMKQKMFVSKDHEIDNNIFDDTFDTVSLEFLRSSFGVCHMI